MRGRFLKAYQYSWEGEFGVSVVGTIICRRWCLYKDHDGLGYYPFSLPSLTANLNTKKNGSKIESQQIR
jgi:hypothetical protein